jgi:hypothetical protein
MKTAPGKRYKNTSKANCSEPRYFYSVMTNCVIAMPAGMMRAVRGILLILICCMSATAAAEPGLPELNYVQRGFYTVISDPASDGFSLNRLRGKVMEQEKLDPGDLPGPNGRDVWDSLRILLHERSVDLGMWKEDLGLWRVLGDHPRLRNPEGGPERLFHESSRPYQEAEILGARERVERSYRKHGENWRGSEYARRVLRYLAGEVRRPEWPFFRSSEETRNPEGGSGCVPVSVGRLFELVGPRLEVKDVADLATKRPLRTETMYLDPDTLAAYARLGSVSDGAVPREYLGILAEHLRSLSLSDACLSIRTAGDTLDFDMDLPLGVKLRVKASPSLKYSFIYSERTRCLRGAGEGCPAEDAYSYAAHMDEGSVKLGLNFTGKALTAFPRVNGPPPMHKARYGIILTEGETVYTQVLGIRNGDVTPLQGPRALGNFKTVLNMDELPDSARLTHESLMLRIEWDWAERRRRGG